MFRALFRKQMMEVNTWLIQDKKTGKRRTSAGVTGLILVYILLFSCLGFVFFGAGTMLCEPLVAIGLGWLYFAMMGLLAILFGVFGSVFNTFSTLYLAKDNEFLLSLPIPPRHILAVRLFGVWMWSLIYEAIVFVPALIAYWIYGSHSVLAVLFGILLLFVLSMLILTLSCLLGWVVAKISSRLKNRSFITVIASLAFIAVYYYVYFRANELIQQILANAETVSTTIKGAVYPIYLMGRAGEGDPLSMLLFTLCISALFLLVYLILDRSFIRIATMNRGAAKTKYREKATKLRSPEGALFSKELKRFTSSPIYMLNCGLGTILFPVAGVVALWKAETVRGLLETTTNASAFVMLIACAGLCMLASMNDITAPSVSLEGKNLWLLQSYPVTPWKVLKAKLKLHLAVTEIPLLFCAACIIFVLKPDFLPALLMLLLPAVFVLLSAAFGLALNLKMPNLKWNDETVPVKQSAGVVITLFGGWGFVAVLAGLYFAFQSFLSAELYLLVCFVIVSAITAFLLLWLKNKGSQIFASL